MTQLLCNNTPLDLYDSAGLQFTDENMLFAFDNIKCERTAQFKLPRTQTNDKLLALARVPAYDGAGMRRKFDAVLMDGQIVKRGYLYVSAFDGTDYEAIFVTGDLLGLQRIKDAGSARDLLLYNNALQWSGTPTAANVRPLPNVGLVRHDVADGAVQSPSVGVQWLADEMAAAIGTEIDWAGVIGAGLLRLIMANSAKMNTTKVHLIRTFEDKQTQTPTAKINPLLGVITADTHTGADWIATVQYNPFEGYYIDDPVTNLYVRGDFENWVCPYDISIKFRDDLPTDFFVISGNAGYDQQGVQQEHWADCVFLGGWSFDRTYGTTLGVPLRGRKISIPANTPFALVRMGDFEFPDLTQTGNTRVGFSFANAAEYDIEVEMDIEHEFVQGDLTPYNALLPDLTLVKILQMVATCEGKVLYYDADENVIGFDGLIFNTWDKIEIEQILKRGEVKRTFSDYAQENAIKFKDDEGVYGYERITRTYEIENDNLTESKVLQTIEASEGGRFGWMENGETLSRLVLRNEKSRLVICTAGDYTSLLRVNLPENSGITRLCDKSTQIKIDARMYALAYNSIKPNTRLLVDGSLYVWTAKNWQKDIASLTLSKI